MSIWGQISYAHNPALSEHIHDTPSRNRGSLSGAVRSHPESCPLRRVSQKRIRHSSAGWLFKAPSFLPTHSFIYSLILYIFTRQLLCASFCAKSKEHRVSVMWSHPYGNLHVEDILGAPSRTWYIEQAGSHYFCLSALTGSIPLSLHQSLSVFYFYLNKGHPETPLGHSARLAPLRLLINFILLLSLLLLLSHPISAIHSCFETI